MEKQKTCTIKNGMEMLTIQAEKAWKIWKVKNTLINIF